MEIEFNYNQIITVIQANLIDKFKDVINKYTQKALLDPDNLCFFQMVELLIQKKLLKVI